MELESAVPRDVAPLGVVWCEALERRIPDHLIADTGRVTLDGPDSPVLDDGPKFAADPHGVDQEPLFPLAVVAHLVENVKQHDPALHLIGRHPRHDGDIAQDEVKASESDQFQESHAAVRCYSYAMVLVVSPMPEGLNRHVRERWPTSAVVATLRVSDELVQAFSVSPR